MPALKKTKTATAKTTKPRARRRKSAPAHDAIAVRAFELYMDHAEGDEVAHWLRAERELSTA
jgi:Protein of unknown function (DUF2934)